MSGRRRQSERDRHRRSLGQNFLSDRSIVAAIIADLELVPGQLVVDLGAGRGALTVPLAESGVRVWAVETDPDWISRLQALLRSKALDDAVRVIKADLRVLRLPTEPFRVVANPPFNLTAQILTVLLERPASPITRVDLVLQRQVARKPAAQPPTTLRTASWAPWWEFSLGRRVPASAFRPRPSVDAAVLTAQGERSVDRRGPPRRPGIGGCQPCRSTSMKVGPSQSGRIDGWRRTAQHHACPLVKSTRAWLVGHGRSR